MKKPLLKFILATLMYVASSLSVQSQNWEYLGSPNLNATVSMFDYMYFADLEFNTSGDAFVGYWQSSQQLKFVKYSGGTWTHLASPGTSAVNNVDIEVKGNNYYIAYSGVRGSNMYVFVKKFDGTVWNQLGDSMLLGNSGSGGHFDFVLDNNEVPTILGVVATTFLSDKQIMQYNGSAWVNYYTFIGSNASIYGESSAIFDSQNKLYCNTQGIVTSPIVSQYNVTHTIDAGVRVTVGDTLYAATNSHVIKFDGSGVPYLCFNNIYLAKTMAFKLNGNVWASIADTSGSIGTLLGADLASNGKLVFNTLSFKPGKSVYIYDNGSRLLMDSVNNQGVAIGTISDIVVPAGSNDVYAMVLEIKTGGAQDVSVMKHAVEGSNGLSTLKKQNSFEVFPNPSSGVITVNQTHFDSNSTLHVYNALGKLVHTTTINQVNQTIDLSAASKGLYFFKLTNGQTQSQRKVIIE